jgi:CheY-like chemotaxis protein
MKTILIVDDDEDDIDFLREAIDKVDNSIRCISAMDGEYALRLLLNEDLHPPDYIFLDLNMPRLGGKQCLSRIKNVPRLSEIPVIIYTTSKLKGDMMETMKLGSVYFLTKPTKLSDLIEYVSNVLQHKWELIQQK